MRSLASPQDVLPLPPAWADGAARRPFAAPPPPGGEQPVGFLSEKDFRERAKALLDALHEQERDREERAVWEAEWEEEMLGVR